MKKWMVYIVGLVLLSGCSSVSVKNDYDVATDFSSYRTYAWLHAEQPKTGNHRLDNDLLDQRIRTAIEQQLTAKGMLLVSQQEADLQVAYFVDFERRLQSSSMSVGIGAGRYGRYGGVQYSPEINDAEYSLLTIDFVDAKNEQMVWRGTGSRGSYQGSNPEKMTRVVNEAVAKILKAFPPQ